MAKSFLLDPVAVADRLQTRFRNQRQAWLRGDGRWPLRVGLGPPTEAQAASHREPVGGWQQSWLGWTGPGEVEWISRRWPTLGMQRLPAAIVFHDASAVAEFVGQGRLWRAAEERLRRVTERWPALLETAPGAWDALAEWDEADFERLLVLLDWLDRHPHSGLLVRQLPVPGVDGKWLEGHKRRILSWLGVLRGVTGDGQDLYELAGLRSLPRRLRLRVLDPALRAFFGGLADIEAPLGDIAVLDLPIEHVFIVENLQTGLAFGDLPGSVVFMKQGYAVDVFADIPWLRSLPVDYWGDLDTNGFAILDRLRAHLPHADSVLMDEQTLLDHRELWGHEAHLATAAELPRLRPGEAALFTDLRSGRWGPGVRLEQERIDWRYAWERIQAAIGNGS